MCSCIVAEPTCNGKPRDTALYTERARPHCLPLRFQSPHMLPNPPVYTAAAAVAAATDLTEQVLQGALVSRETLHDEARGRDHREPAVGNLLVREVLCHLKAERVEREVARRAHARQAALRRRDARRDLDH